MNVSQRYPDMEVSPITIGLLFRFHSPGSIKLVQRIRPDRDGPATPLCAGALHQRENPYGFKKAGNLEIPNFSSI
jgi:hypothetical protein